MIESPGRRLHRLVASLALAVAMTCPCKARSISSLSQGPVIEVRLQTHVSSYLSRPGDEIRAVVVTPCKKDGYVLIPRGSIAIGHVVQAHRVGYGLVRERASLKFEFNAWEHPDGTRHKLSADLVLIDNAREEVTNQGKVKGILAAGGAPGFILGLWREPDPSTLVRSAYGFAGVSRFLLMKAPFTPLGVAGVVALRFLVVRWPEPEIHFSPGTDMLLSLRATPETSVRQPETVPEPVPEPLVELANAQPIESMRPRSGSAADITNLLFVGSKEEVERAFEQAGWNLSEPLNRETGIRICRAISAQRGYPTAPMSLLRLEGASPDMMFQKSLNTFTKRHHIRLWKRPGEYEGKDIWAAAATHDTAIRPSGFGFTHETDPFIDRERFKVLQDLKFAGCVEQANLIDRPKLSGFSRPDTVTDGRMAVVRIRECNRPFEIAGSDYPLPVQRKGFYRRLARRFVLEGRQAVTRGNVYYWGYRVARLGISRFFPVSDHATGVASLRPVD
ncbi:MAG: LssY C-terminal domain-containing protein [Bryobacterales bacterium]|nr:LssY C-terminal domain-containing protein [Bryobacterales bacterium]